ncbi:hypothetical protein F8B43_1356 [Methylorubrum populi]|uniref:Uncharacterized protein n=1 Tax=Methylorubrum populi TaxID=223967 RepID=A0A833J760_9HYPH|nr:hypothetical protein F8B43_1356 [Methylorubrum populi]
MLSHAPNPVPTPSQPCFKAAPRALRASPHAESSGPAPAVVQSQDRFEPYFPNRLMHSRCFHRRCGPLDCASPVQDLRAAAGTSSRPEQTLCRGR